jgi:hypothetical protein
MGMCIWRWIPFCAIVKRQQLMMKLFEGLRVRRAELFQVSGYEQLYARF